MRFFDTSRDSLEDIRAALTARDEESDTNIENVVREIVADIRRRGDAAVLEYTQKYDWPGAADLEVAITALSTTYTNYSAADRTMLADVAANIGAFHTEELSHLKSWTLDSADGKVLGQVIQPVNRVGIYVPGGLAAYPSTVLMTAIPARVAGVTEIVLCTPPDRNGSLPQLVCAAAEQHVDRLFKIGGAQAIAAMAYGTESVPKCDIIVGPGNAYVNTAKRLVYGQVGIDMLAGPSEVAIVADPEANPAWAAADMLAQTEHGHDNRAVLFSNSLDFIKECQNALTDQRTRLTRQSVVAVTEQNTIFIKTGSITECIDLVNEMAPEHLQLMVREPMELMPSVRNAGAVLMGDYTSAPLGDYWAGPSHTLPTAGAARFSSPLSVATFMKRTNFLQYSQAAAADAARFVERFALAEGFDGHARAAMTRSQETSAE